jgi:hypothetical protein
MAGRNGISAFTAFSPSHATEMLDTVKSGLNSNLSILNVEFESAELNAAS